MHSNSLHATALLFLSFSILCYPAVSQVSASGAVDAAAQSTETAARGLPSFLLQVPDGSVLMGMEVDDFVAASSQAAFPFNPDQAHKIAAEKLRKTMRRSSSVVGRKQLPVPTFFLGKWPVKNSEYATYVDKQRANKVAIRPPFHWWRYGCKEDYEKHLPDIRKAFPKDPAGALLYWEREGKNLPYKLLDEDGKSIADHPVVFITWRDANQFAASIGMRLPTEAELTRAMRGDGTNAWPNSDKFTPDMLTQLGMGSSSQYHTKPTGTVKAAAGPFGHLDMYGQVWQFVGDLGFDPIHDMDTFLKNWGLLQKHRIGRLCQKKPTYQGHLAIAKGGSFLSYQEPIQLMLDTRAPIQTSDSLESLGMRLSKSIQPGFDYLYSLQRVKFNTSAFAKDQELNLAELIGAERYSLAANGFPEQYEAIAFAPVNWLRNEKNTRVKTVLEESQVKPMLIGAIATTANFDNGSEKGLYSVFYRNAGIPRELRDAIKMGHKEIVRARKEAEKSKGKSKSKSKSKKDDKKKQDRVRKWRLVTKTFGLSDDDVGSAKAATGDCGYVIIDDIKIPTDRDAFILSTTGKMVSVLPGTNKKPASKDVTPSSLVIEPGTNSQKDKAVAKFRFGIPLLQRNPKKVVVFDLHAVLDQDPPSVDKPWRLPTPK